MDAIAEYIDNSIQACTDEISRNIRICMFLTSSSPQGYFLILDNGTGMNVQTIQEFATYSLDQASRNQAPSADNKSFIGKFGVGAKQAGFYLGTRIKLFTRPLEYQDTSIALSFCLDSEELHHRYSNKESVYAGTVRAVDMNQPLQLYSDEMVFPQMATILQDHFRDLPHGTAFMVKLRPDEIIPKLKKMSECALEKQIKDIFHFHLHPEHSQENILNVISQQKDLLQESQR